MSIEIASKQRTERPSSRVLLMRVGFVVSLIGGIGAWCGSVYCMVNHWEIGAPVCFAVGFPCMGFVVLTDLSCSAFYFDYSLLGQLLPAEAPAKWMPVASTSSSVAIGNHFHATFPLLTCEFGLGGIRLRVFFYPKVFIASKQIVSIANDSWGCSLIEHTSHEIRGPIRVMNHVVREMVRCMPELSLVRS